MSWMTMVLILLLQVTPTPRQVTVTLTDAAGRPVAGQMMELSIFRPMTRQPCVTDAQGQCTFTVSTGEELVEGMLLLVGRGQRSVLWKGDSLDLALQLDAAGLLHTPYDFTGPPAPPLQTAVAATAMPQTPTAPWTPTTALGVAPLPAATPVVTVGGTATAVFTPVGRAAGAALPAATAADAGPEAAPARAHNGWAWVLTGLGTLLLLLLIAGVWAALPAAGGGG